MASNPVILPGAKGMYDDLLSRNAQNYSNVLSAYTQGQANLSASMPGIAAGYNDLTRNTTGLLQQGYDLGHADIQKQNAVNQANVTQQAMSRGLGNSTVWANYANQANEQTQRALAGLAYNTASGAADRYQQIGLARQAAQMQGLGLQTSLYGQQGGSLAGYHFNNAFGNLYGQSSNDAGGGGGHGGGAGAYSSPLDNQMFPFGAPTGIAPPGASSYGSTGGYANPYGGYGGPGTGGVGGGGLPIGGTDYSNLAGLVGGGLGGYFGGGGGDYSNLAGLVGGADIGAFF